MKKKTISQICHELEGLYHQLVEHDVGPRIISHQSERERVISEAKEFTEMAWHRIKDNIKVKKII